MCLFYIDVGANFVDLTWEKVYIIIWEAFRNVYLLRVVFDRPEMTRAVDGTLKSN